MNGSIIDRVTMHDVLRIASLPAADKRGFTGCPFHADETPSLHLVGPTGREKGYKCFACGESGGILDFLVKTKIATDPAHAARILEEQLGEAAPKPRVVASYVYDNGDEQPVARIDRIEPGRNGRDKDFLPYLAAGDGFAEKPGLNGTKLPLYRRTELLKTAGEGGTVFLVEGEGKADALRETLRAGGSSAAVTTVQGGANAVLRDEQIADLAGAKAVVVFCDSDAPGRTAASLRACQIARFHSTTDTRVVDCYPDHTDGSDAGDWIREGHTVAELRRLTATATRVTPDSSGPQMEAKPEALSAPGIIGASAAVSALITVRADEVKSKRTEWFAKDRIPFGSVTLFDGSGGIGKTTLLLGVIAAATCGRRFFDGDEIAPISALVIAEEDSLGLLKARLQVAGANLSRVHFVKSVELGDVREPFTIPKHVEALERTATDLGAQVIYMDALFSHLDLEGEGRMSQQVRRALRPLIEMAERTGAAVLATRHWQKAHGPARDRALGSIELSNIARSVLSFGPHPDREGAFVFVPTKANLSALAPALAYRIDVVEQTDDDGEPWQVTQAVLDGEADGVTADDLAMRQVGDPDERGAAEEWLADFLGDREWHDATDLYPAARKQGAGSPATIRRAAARLGVERDRSGFPSRSRWRLLADCSQSAHSQSVSKLEQTGDQTEQTPADNGSVNGVEVATKPWDGVVRSAPDAQRIFDHARELGLRGQAQSPGQSELCYDRAARPSA
jgi:hypothetical protein